MKERDEPHTANTGPLRENKLKIIIAGCGGTGGFAAESVCRLLTGREDEILLVDPDTVEPHNLLRQNFYRRDVGRNKAQALAERLAVNYDRRIGYARREFKRTDPEGLNAAVYHREGASAAILIGCVDTAEGRREMHQAVIKANGNLWAMDAGNGEHWGQVLAGNAHRLEDEIDNFHDGHVHKVPAPALQRPDLLQDSPPEEPRLDCAQAIDLTGQDPNINRFMADLVTLVLKDLMTGQCRRMAVYADLANASMHEVPITRNTLAPMAPKPTMTTAAMASVAHQPPLYEN